MRVFTPCQLSNIKDQLKNLSSDTPSLTVSITLKQLCYQLILQHIFFKCFTHLGFTICRISTTKNNKYLFLQVKIILRKEQPNRFITKDGEFVICKISSVYAFILILSKTKMLKKALSAS